MSRFDRAKARPRTSRRPALERLETRAVPAYLTPITGGLGSLTAAGLVEASDFDAIPAPKTITRSSSVANDRVHSASASGEVRWQQGRVQGIGVAFLVANAQASSYWATPWDPATTGAPAAAEAGSRAPEGEVGAPITMRITPDEGEEVGAVVQIAITVDFRATTDLGATVDYAVTYAYPSGEAAATVASGVTTAAGGGQAVFFARIGDEIRIASKLHAAAVGTGPEVANGAFELTTLIELGPARPNLAIEAVENREGRIAFGYAAAGVDGPFGAALYQSMDAAWDPSDRLVDRITIEPGASRGSSSFSADGLARGYPYVFVVADPLGAPADPYPADDARSIAFAAPPIDLFAGGDGDGAATIDVDPSRGVYLTRVEVLAGDTLRLSALDRSGASATDVDAVLRIFSDDGTPFAEIDGTVPGSGGEAYTHTFDAGGVYWIGVGTQAQRDYTPSVPSSSEDDGPGFRFQAELAGRDDVEPDDAAAATTPVAFAAGRYVRSTTIAGRDDVDVYRIDALAGNRYVVRTSRPTTAVTPGAAVATVYDASGRKVAGTVVGGDSGEFAFTVVAGGRYYVMVAGRAGPDRIALDLPDVDPPTRTRGDGDLSVAYTRDGGWDYALAVEEQVRPLLLAAKPLFLDRGPDGIWGWSEGVGLQQLAIDDPEGIVAAPDGSLYIDYGPRGLWRWSAAGGLALVNAAPPQAMTAAADGRLYIDYGPYGLWRWAEGRMEQLNAADPQALAAGADGRLYVDYGPYGLWRWAEGRMGQLNTADPEGMVAAADGSLFIDYGPYGLWRWSDGSIRQLNSGDPQALAAAAGSLYIDYGPFGLWRWSADGFTQLNSGDPERLAAGSDGTLYIDFGVFGAWRWTTRGGFVRLAEFDPQNFAVG
ncbi:hypothetical protein [Paludisphaera mucosa]|uniref:Calx-beta domain-containing protein n=1 Tax=Paludisphaera mucosa TaxID=3030827 RepID=A0ABT6FAI7_9BACT|nr:hypothetical protein [Paludisphaera mucosa]MDG3004606.1 hypothetical protein [Paludisphaera mucosa]